MRPSPTLEPRSTPRPADDRSLPALIHGARGPLVVESHFAGWERPWRALSAEAWDELARLLGRFESAVVETGASRDLALRYGLEVIPTVLVFLDGEVVARLTGSLTAERVADAVRAAQQQQGTLARAGLELESPAEARATSPARSILRRRAEAPVLAYAG